MVGKTEKGKTGGTERARTSTREVGTKPDGW